jgi:hypothetical protein
MQLVNNGVHYSQIFFYHYIVLDETYLFLRNPQVKIGVKTFWPKLSFVKSVPGAAGPWRAASRGRAT